MPTKYRFITNGDFVDFYDDAQHILSVDKLSRVLTWFFDSTPGIVFTITNNSYHTHDVGDISFDDVVVTSQDDFITKAQSMFPELATGEGSPQGIDDVLAVEQIFTEDRLINLTGKKLTINGNNVSLIIDDVQSFVDIGDVFIVSSGKITLSISEFSDNAAALSGGVPNGALYYTTVEGERIIKQAHD